MRLSVNLDPDLYALARAVATAEDCSLSGAVNRLLRRCLERRGRPSTRGASQIPVVRCRRRFTAADVERLEAVDEGA